MLTSEDKAPSARINVDARGNPELARLYSRCIRLPAAVGPIPEISILKQHAERTIIHRIPTPAELQLPLFNQESGVPQVALVKGVEESLRRYGVSCFDLKSGIFREFRPSEGPDPQIERGALESEGELGRKVFQLFSPQGFVSHSFQGEG